jgi:hypothetical protein
LTFLKGIIIPPEKMENGKLLPKLLSSKERTENSRKRDPN